MEITARVALSQPAFLSRIDGGTAAGRRVASLQRARRAVASARGPMQFVGAGRLEPDAQLGWNVRPGRHTDDGHLTTILPERRRLTPPAPAGAPRITLVGDSFTLGDEVDDAETWAWKLADLASADVHNLGVLGYGLDQALLRAERDVLSDPPDHLVLGVVPLMLVRSHLDWDAWQKPRFELDHDALILRGVPLEPPRDLLARPGSRALDLLQIWRETLAGGLAHAPQEDPLLDALVARFVQGARAAGSTPWLVFLPTEAEYARPEAWTGRGPDGWRSFQAWCAELAVDCVDLAPAFRDAHAAGVALDQGAHWSDAGHTLVAEGVGRALAARGGDLPPR